MSGIQVVADYVEDTQVSSEQLEQGEFYENSSKDIVMLVFDTTGKAYLLNLRTVSLSHLEDDLVGKFTCKESIKSITLRRK